MSGAVRRSQRQGRIDTIPTSSSRDVCAERITRGGCIVLMKWVWGKTIETDYHLELLAERHQDFIIVPRALLGQWRRLSTLFGSRLSRRTSRRVICQVGGSHRARAAVAAGAERLAATPP